jgi:hypothetical protein
MKRLQILAMAAVLVLGISSWAGASVSAQFWVYDGPDTDHNVALTVTDFLLLTPATLQYNIGGTWTNLFPGNNSLTIGANPSQLIQFRLDLGSSNYLYDAEMSWGAPAGSLFNGVSLNFGPYWAFAFCTPGGTDHVGNAPTTTPIPAAAWLLGSGLLGLIGIGKRGYFGNA